VVATGFLLLAAFDACTGALPFHESEIDTITLRVMGLKVGDGDPCNNLDPDKVLKSIIIREGETTVARVRILARDAEVLRTWGRHKRRCAFSFEQAVRVPNVDPAAVTVTGDGETKALPREVLDPDLDGCIGRCGVHYVFFPFVQFVARGSESRGTAVGAQG
jgi:hypothetical protein